MSNSVTAVIGNLPSMTLGKQPAEKPAGRTGEAPRGPQARLREHMRELSGIDAPIFTYDVKGSIKTLHHRPSAAAVLREAMEKAGSGEARGEVTRLLERLEAHAERAAKATPALDGVAVQPADAADNMQRAAASGSLLSDDGPPGGSASKLLETIRQRIAAGTSDSPGPSVQVDNLR